MNIIKFNMHMSQWLPQSPVRHHRSFEVGNCASRPLAGEHFAFRPLSAGVGVLNRLTLGPQEPKGDADCRLRLPHATHMNINIRNYVYIYIHIILYDIVLYYINYWIYWSFIGFNQPKQDETNEQLGRLVIATNFVAVWWLSNKSGVCNV